MQKIYEYLFYSLLLMSCNCFAINNKISKNTLVQHLYDDGMLYYYAYSYSQAEYNFRLSLFYEPTCGPCYLGLALAKKHQALELKKPFAQVGFKEMTKAKQLIKNYEPFFNDFFHALDASFSMAPYANETQLQKNYITALRDLNEKYKNDSMWKEESLALFVDSIAYYGSVGSGEIKNHCGGVLSDDLKDEAISLIKVAILDKTYRPHPGILHTYIHLSETNLTDPLALVAAKLLPTFSKNKISHYVHMPNHIYWRRGMYKEAIKANLAAIDTDYRYFKNGGIGLNTYYYYYHFLHSHHFLAVLGILTNNEQLSLKYAHEVKTLLDPTALDSLADYRDILLTVEDLALARFEKWQLIKSLPPYEGLGVLGHILSHFSQALASLNLMDDKSFTEFYQKIDSVNSTNVGIIDLKKLTLTYLNASKMSQKGANFKNIKLYFEKNNIPQIEKKLFKMNPPVWFFPYSLFLSDYAFELGDMRLAKKYNKIYQSLYPKSSLAKVERLVLKTSY